MRVSRALLGGKPVPAAVVAVLNWTAWIFPLRAPMERCIRDLGLLRSIEEAINCIQFASPYLALPCMVADESRCQHGKLDWTYRLDRTF